MLRSSWSMTGFAPEAACDAAVLAHTEPQDLVRAGKAKSGIRRSTLLGNRVMVGIDSRTNSYTVHRQCSAAVYRGDPAAVMRRAT